MRKWINFISIILTVRYSFSLKVYRSLLPIESTEGIAGLHYLNENSNLVASSLTFCLRFNYKKLGPTIWHMRKPEEKNSLMYLGAWYPNTWFNFGRKWWILKDPIRDSFLVWYANKWHHLCVAYDRVNDTLTMVKVNKYKSNFLTYLSSYRQLISILIQRMDN